jgi:hypothetical protein
MSDRELLELAAKAAGIAILRSRLENPMCADMLLVEHTSDGHAIGWNPLTENGDAFRLASTLMLTVEFGNNMVQYPVEGVGVGTNPLKATRHAIVLAAAAIGKAMP